MGGDQAHRRGEKYPPTEEASGTNGPPGGGPGKHLQMCRSAWESEEGKGAVHLLSVHEGGKKGFRFRLNPEDSPCEIRIYLRGEGPNTVKQRSGRLQRRLRREVSVGTGVLGFLVGWSLTLGAPQLSGQAGSYAFQIRGGGTLSIGQFADENQGWEKKAGSGTSLGMGFIFPVYRVIGGYVGFSQHRFSCDQGVCPKDEAWVSTGFDMAVRIVMGEEGVGPWFQGGLHTHRMEVGVMAEGKTRDLTSQGGWGYEIGCGLLLRIGERTSLSPGVRYGLGNVPFAGRPNVGLRFLVFDLGLVLGF